MSHGGAVHVERSCFHDLAGTGGGGGGGGSPILLLEESGVPVPFVDGKDNFVEGTWACKFARNGLDVNSTCQEATNPSDRCLAQIENYSHR